MADCKNMLKHFLGFYCTPAHASSRTKVMVWWAFHWLIGSLIWAFCWVEAYFLPFLRFVSSKYQYVAHWLQYFWKWEKIELYRRRFRGTSISNWTYAKIFPIIICCKRGSSLKIRLCGSFHADEVWLIHQFYRDTTTDTPTSQRLDIFSVVCNPYTSCLAVSSQLFCQFWPQLETGGLLHKNSSGNKFPWLQKQCYNDCKLRLHETINFLLSTGSNINLNSMVWFFCWNLWEDHILERTGFVFA